MTASLPYSWSLVSRAPKLFRPRISCSASGSFWGDSLLDLVGAVLATLGVGWGLQKVANAGYRTFPTSSLICPSCVAGVAAAFPPDEDAFIYSAWAFVGDKIQYDLFSSDITFVNSSVKCKDCELPSATLQSGNSNCVGSSALLASLLRNRLPPERVLMAVGDYSRNGVGGHAWVEVLRSDGWYVLEATAPPQGWRRASDAPEYTPLVYFNDVVRTCLEETLCVGIGRCGSLRL